MLGPIAVLLGVGLVLGCWPAVGDAVARAAAQFTDHAGYLAAVFGHGAPPAPPVPEAGWTVSGVLLGLLSTALAAGLAAVLLWPPWRAGAGRLGRPPVAVLHRLHSGHLGDYVAWLVLGTAAVAALLGLAP
jgi:multicomponent Na+:H+ antiporter subunit D